MIELTIIAAEAREYEKEHGWPLDFNLSLAPIRCTRCGDWGWAGGCGIFFEEHPTEGPTYWGAAGDTHCHCYGLAEAFRLSGPDRPVVIPGELRWHYCGTCTAALLPFARRIRDIYELNCEANKLERTIRGKRQGNQNDGATPHDSRQRGQGRAERRPCHR